VNLKKSYDILLLLFFLAAITSPLVKGVITPDRKESMHEKRVLAELPEIPKTFARVGSFSADFEKYYNDHFGFRDELIQRYHQEMARRFNLTGNPLVIKGQEEWYFYTANSLIGDFLGEFEFKRDAFKEWYDEQIWRYRWLEERGIKYITFSPPNKQTVYPEKMAEELRAAAGITRMSQLHRYLDEYPHPFYVKLEDTMKEAKSKRKLYFAMDTHWNLFGAYIGFREVMEKLADFFPEQQFTSEFVFHKKDLKVSGGDLAEMLMIGQDTYEYVPMIAPRKNCGEEAEFALKLTDVSSIMYERPLLKQCKGRNLRAVVFADSFILNIEPFLSENFREILYLQKSYDHSNVLEIIDTFKPDIIIEERAERNFFRDFAKTEH